MTDSTQYAPAVKALHWIVAALVAAMAGVGWYMMSIEHDPGGPRLFALHKSVGLVFLVLMLVRIAVRAANPRPPLPTSMPRWQILLSTATQMGLYLLLLLMPLTGYLGASYSKSGVPFFGAATPRWAVANHDMAERFFDLHSTLIWIIVALVVLHVAGALKHLLMDKDRVFQFMWKG